MRTPLEKSTIFITKNIENNLHLLLIHHPLGGIQFPSGTVEAGETPLDAAIRKTNEATGLETFLLKNLIGSEEVLLNKRLLAVLNTSKVYARPSIKSYDWITIRRGIYLNFLREMDDFYQINYNEYDDFVQRNYKTYEIVGWIPKKSVTNVVKRYFYHFEVEDTKRNQWQKVIDGNAFKIKWYPLADLPEIVKPQEQWLRYIKYIK